MEIIHLTNQNFKELINEKVLVDFYANWCGPCKMIGPELERAEGNIKVIKIDVDEFEDIAKEYGVMSIPTLILFNEGKESEFCARFGYHSRHPGGSLYQLYPFCMGRVLRALGCKSIFAGGRYCSTYSKGQGHRLQRCRLRCYIYVSISRFVGVYPQR